MLVYIGFMEDSSQGRLQTSAASLGRTQLSMTTTIPRICASIAGKASPLGVVIHDAAYKAAGIDYKYIAVEAADLDEAVHALVALNVRGFALSMPHKAAII